MRYESKFQSNANKIAIIQIFTFDFVFALVSQFIILFLLFSLFLFLICFLNSIAFRIFAISLGHKVISHGKNQESNKGEGANPS